MREKLFLFVIVLFAMEANATTNKLVDCRLISPKTTECKPYPSKFMYVKKLSTGKHIDFRQEHKLIISKTVPYIEKPKIVKIISVEDMIENHLEVLEPSRFSSIKSHTPIEFAEEKDDVVVATEDTNATIADDLNITYIADSNKTDKPKEIKKLIVDISKKYPKYTIKKGDSLNRIAKKFGIATKKILDININLSGSSILKIGQKINIPSSKQKVDKIVKKDKRDKKSKLAKRLKKKYLAAKKRKKTKKNYNKKLISTVRGKHSLRVQATAYSSHRGQTDKTPFLAAWNNRIRPGMKIIAVSRDLIYKYGLGNGKRVRIQGLPGYYTVRDKMNKRYTKRIDIYMGIDRRKALRWGRRRTVIYW